ncbi:Programmed cell death protein 2-like [Bagarius yarrelli]|uniref:Programmed cell death protein 2-like n=1 Tax=Bagarius yarrelli TaxID=175774 RepID=A0A556TRJ0_BAGYA|nr:Programmed cell death protein 2-like [Bagarius yarrelli]
MEESILIGICDSAIDKKKDTSYYTNKIGGYPLEVCRSQCLESEIKEPSACQSSFREPVATTDWCDDADDWGMEEKSSNEQNCADHSEKPNLTASLDVSSRLQDLCINSTEGLQSAGAATDCPTFQPFYISVVEEADLVGQNDFEHANRLLKEYEEREGVAIREITRCEGGRGEEAYEKSKAKHGDAVFSAFMKRITSCPEQVLRYSWSGTPLFIMEPPSNVNETAPPCEHCGSPRVFEFQLMPALVSLLRSTRLTTEFSVEFGTVLIYTCRDSCWTSGSSSPVDEFSFVQTDPDQKLFK